MKIVKDKAGKITIVNDKGHEDDLLLRKIFRRAYLGYDDYTDAQLTTMATILEKLEDIR